MSTIVDIRWCVLESIQFLCLKYEERTCFYIFFYHSVCWLQPFNLDYIFLWSVLRCFRDVTNVFFFFLRVFITNDTAWETLKGTLWFFALMNLMCLLKCECNCTMMTLIKEHFKIIWLLRLCWNDFVFCACYHFFFFYCPQRQSCLFSNTSFNTEYNFWHISIFSTIC